MRIKVERKVIPESFLKIEGRGDARWGERPEREGPIEELVDDQNPCPEAPPRSRIERRGESKGNVRGGATIRGAMEKSRYVRVIEGEEVRRNDPVEYFSLLGNGSTS